MCLNVIFSSGEAHVEVCCQQHGSHVEHVIEMNMFFCVETFISPMHGNLLHTLYLFIMFRSAYSDTHSMFTFQILFHIFCSICFLYSFLYIMFNMFLIFFFILFTMLYGRYIYCFPFHTYLFCCVSSSVCYIYGCVPHVYTCILYIVVKTR